MISEAIQSACEMIKSFFNLRQSDIENKPTLEIVKDKKDLKKASNYAEKIIDIAEKYSKYFTKTDLNHFNSWKKQFKKYN